MHFVTTNIIARVFLPRYSIHSIGYCAGFCCLCHKQNDTTVAPTHLLDEGVVTEHFAGLHDSHDGGLKVHLAVLVHSAPRLLHLLRGTANKRAVNSTPGITTRGSPRVAVKAVCVCVCVSVRFISPAVCPSASTLWSWILSFYSWSSYLVKTWTRVRCPPVRKSWSEWVSEWFITRRLLLWSYTGGLVDCTSHVAQYLFRCQTMWKALP